MNEAAEVRPADEAVIVKRIKKNLALGNKSSWDVADDYVRLSGLGWTQQGIADEFDTVQSSVSYFLGAARKYLLGDIRPPFWDAYAEVKGVNGSAATAHVGHNSGEVEWYTPGEYLDAARAVLGEIDLDPASSKKAQERVQAGAYYTKKDDGLSKTWAGRVFLNPPYAQPLIDQFCEKVVQEYHSGAVSAAVVLVNNATETTWFAGCAAAARAICFPTGRVKFLNPQGEPKGAPLQGQAVIYFGDNPAAFLSAFAGFGFCAEVRREC